MKHEFTDMTLKLRFNPSSRGILDHKNQKIAQKVWSNVKVMFNVFFDFNSIVHQEFLVRGQTINKEYYLKIECRLHEAI